MKSLLLAFVCAFLAIEANAAWLGRLEDPSGSGEYLAVYDDQLDITWALDASMTGRATWGSQQSWVSTLVLGGISGWRLPEMDVNSNGIISNCANSITQASCSDNELGHLYYYGEGSVKGQGVTYFNPGPFTGFDTNWSWSGNTYGPSPTTAWVFLMTSGAQIQTNKGQLLTAMAVYDGDVANVPLPAAAWLFLSAIGGLVVIKRKRS